jgi:hypothetical protein
MHLVRFCAEAEMWSNRNNPYYLMITFLTIIAGIFIISGCSSHENKKTQFESIENQETSGAGQYFPGKDIHLVVISSKDQVGDLDSWISRDAQSTLEKLDYSSFFALAIFQGIKPTNRYSIEITRVTREGNTVNLETRIQNRDPELEAADVETSPYHLISIAKAGTWNGDFDFNVIQNGNIITSTTTHFIP